MAVVSNICTSGVNLILKGEPPFSILEHDPAYGAFLNLRDVDGRFLDVVIDVETSNMPAVSELKQVFESGQSWKLYSGLEEHFILLHPPAFNRPVLMIRMNRDFTAGTAYCGEKLTDRIDGRPFIWNPLHYPLDQVLIMCLLSGRDGALFHAAGLRFGDRGFIFPGKSGAGKTTLTRELIGDGRMKALSDDRMIVRMLDGMYRMFGTPWPGEAGVAVNESAPLSGIFFLKHGTENRITRLSAQAAFERLMPVTSVPWFHEEMMYGVLTTCEQITVAVPTFELCFNPKTQLSDYLYDFVSSEKYI